MDVLAVPQKREDGWYLSLMAPNTKGPKFAWLDPSRLYCNSQVNNHSVACKAYSVQGTLLNNLALKFVSWGVEGKVRIGWQPWALKFKVSELSFLLLLADPGTVRLCKRSSQTIPKWDHWPGGWNRCHGLHPRYKTFCFVADSLNSRDNIFSSVHMLQEK